MDEGNFNLGRRDFFRRSVGITGGILLAGSALGAAGCEETTIKPQAPFTIDGNKLLINVDQAPNLTAPGGHSAFNALGKQILVFRLTAESVSAISRICTHEGCDLGDGTVNGDRIVCPCHGSSFLTASGEVVKGPATISVRSFPATLSGNTIVVDLA